MGRVERDREIARRRVRKEKLTKYRKAYAEASSDEEKQEDSGEGQQDQPVRRSWKNLPKRSELMTDNSIKGLPDAGALFLLLSFWNTPSCFCLIDKSCHAQPTQRTSGTASRRGNPRWTRR